MDYPEYQEYDILDPDTSEEEIDEEEEGQFNAR